MEKPRIIEQGKKLLATASLVLALNLWYSQDSLDYHLNAIISSANKQEHIDKFLEQIDSIPNCKILFKGKKHEPVVFLNTFYNDKMFRKRTKLEVEGIKREENETVIKVSSRHN